MAVMVVVPELANAYGLHEALVLRQLHYWLQRATCADGGRPWVYKSITEWSEEFTWWQRSTVHRLMTKLADDELIEIRMADGRTYYTINYDKLHSDCRAALVMLSEYRTGEPKEVIHVPVKPSENRTGRQHATVMLSESRTIDTNEPVEVSEIQTDPSENRTAHNKEVTEITTEKQEREEEDAQARDPLTLAWRQAYGDTIPKHLTESLGKLVSERGIAATIHGIKSGAKADSRNFRYIAECARNYVPPAPLASYVNGNGPGYAVDLPGSAGEAFNPTIHPVQHLPYKPPPMSTSDPWSVLVAELSVTLAGGFVPTLQESQLEEVGEIDGEDGRSMPCYRVIVPSARAGTLEHFKRQAGVEIQKRLSVILRKRVLVEIVAAEQEQQPA